MRMMWNLLNFFSIMAHLWTLKMLLVRLICNLDKATPNELIFEGNTPLHYAVLAKDVERVKLLVSRKCDINAANNSGSTALHLASCDPEIANVLLNSISEEELPITVNSVDNVGNSPLHLAVRGNEICSWNIGLFHLLLFVNIVHFFRSAQGHSPRSGRHQSCSFGCCQSQQQNST